MSKMASTMRIFLTACLAKAGLKVYFWNLMHKSLKTAIPRFPVTKLQLWMTVLNQYSQKVSMPNICSGGVPLAKGIMIMTVKMKLDMI